MVVLLNGVKVGLPYMANNGQPVFWNALYDGVQVWPPAAETLVDMWLKPVDFTAQALYPTIRKSRWPLRRFSPTVTSKTHP